MRLPDGRELKRKPLVSRDLNDKEHVIVHELRWAEHLAPRTLCGRFTIRSEPTPGQIERDKDLVVNCLGCIAEMED